MRYVFLKVILASLVCSASVLADDLTKYEMPLKPEQRRHWAFQPLARPAIPTVRNVSWARSPIDAFILSKLERRGWQPAPPVDKRAFLRRLYLDLTGLPPTPAEMDAFLADQSPNAVTSQIDDLLGRPGYGERWGRHWLDLVRYAESNGYERDGVKPSAWRYRDYALRSFNADKPYDRFVLEQLAGDELPDADAESMFGLGFTRLGPWDDEPADPMEDRFDQLDDMVSTTAQAFLGMTLGCARCHNHKFEPLSQLDYYRMVAIFDPLQRPPSFMRADLDAPALPPRKWKARSVSTAVAMLSCGGIAQAAMATWLMDVPRGYFHQENTAKLPQTHLLIRGKAARPGPVVEPGIPHVLCSTQPNFPESGPYTSQRRLTLARWIVGSPLAARVIVNRIWQFHFGEGLVRTPSDFGVNGQAPTHPELLDWLATEFVRQGWSIKQLHRVILLSNTYRMSKRRNEAYARADPDNYFWWRFPYRRLEVEAIRDSVLLASGQLNRRLFGPSMFPEVPKEALAANSDPDKIWKASNEKDASRRTVYAFIKRSMVVPLLEVLDLCDTTRTSAQRLTTTVAPQALSLFNGDFIQHQARYLADRLEREAPGDGRREIDRAFQLTLCRPPTAAESAVMSQYLNQGDRRQALEQVCRVLFNLNEFVYPD
ncbi:MAG TPA: DUF1549 and DUF1553 domain-containing protein [Gemmataceae bacterium]|nr:DUF1549 and DUF1553 domain-containing protein [Gemmataceae bacterium]